MPFRDNYTNFWFNDISSETMKVWMTNNKDLQFQLTPSFTDTFVAPVAAKTRYHTATTFTSSDLQIKCIAIGVTQRDWRAIQNWLMPNRKGKLQFDFNDNTYYEVKVKQQIKGTSFVEGSRGYIEGDVYNIEFTIDFTTVGDWAAMGPQVVVPINEKFQDFESVEAIAPAQDQLKDLSQLTVKLTISYNEVTSNSANWYKADWWEEQFDSTHSHSAIWISYLRKDNVTSQATISLILQAIANMNVPTIAAAINNKFFVPMIYNKTQSRNTSTPFIAGATAISNSKNRVYLTQPTIIHNKTIKLDTEYYNPDIAGFSSLQYYLFDASLEWLEGYDGETVDLTKLRSNYIASIAQETLVNLDNTTGMVMSYHPNEQDYGLEAKTLLDSNGFAFFGMPVLFAASTNAAYEACPFYYEEEEDTYAIMNAGSYESYPDLYVNLGSLTNTHILKNGTLLYDYNVAIKNTALQFNGKTGFATFNNMLAEAATLSSGAGNTKVVTSSTNNGLLSIDSGNPELIKIRVFGMTESKFARTDGSEAVDPVGLTHIFFQPVGDFKYARNNPFAVLLFKNVVKEQLYNNKQYPLISRNYLESSTYGSNITDYTFTTNAFISKNLIGKGNYMWTLTLPTDEVTSPTLTGLTINDDGFITDYDKTPVYMYLSLCDYTELTVVSDTSNASYFMMQTRDAF